MDVLLELGNDVARLWATYAPTYLNGVKNTLILAVIATFFGCVIGLLCGMGSAPIDSDITCAAIGEGLWVSVEDGVVTLLDEAPAGAEVPAEEVPAEPEE